VLAVELEAVKETLASLAAVAATVDKGNSWSRKTGTATTTATATDLRERSGSPLSRGGFSDCLDAPSMLFLLLCFGGHVDGGGGGDGFDGGGDGDCFDGGAAVIPPRLGFLAVLLHPSLWLPLWCFPPCDLN